MRSASSSHDVMRRRLSRSPVKARLARHPRGLKLTVWPRRRLPLPNVLGREVFISNTFNIVELATAEAKATGLAQDVVKASEKSRLQIPPVDGKVQQLAVHTVGGVVTPAQALLEVVPLDSRLEIEAMVQNRDIGFVRTGQPGEIKVDTFNFNILPDTGCCTAPC